VAERFTNSVPFQDVEYPIGANTKAEAGHIGVLENGLLVEGKAGTGLKAVGIIKQTVDNTGGAAGALPVCVERGYGPNGPRAHRIKNATGAGNALTQADVGNDCYVYDAETLGKDSTGRSVFGELIRVLADGTVLAWCK
jgi:hypothetical protein